MGFVLRREVEVVASLVSELSGAGQSRAESSRGVLLGVYFLLLLLMVITTIPIPPLQVRAQVPPSPSSRRRRIRHRRLRRRRPLRRSLSWERTKI
jgi:hypothetical protein